MPSVLRSSHSIVCTTLQTQHCSQNSFKSFEKPKRNVCRGSNEIKGYLAVENNYGASFIFWVNDGTLASKGHLKRNKSLRYLHALSACAFSLPSTNRTHKIHEFFHTSQHPFIHVTHKPGFPAYLFHCSTITEQETTSSTNHSTILPQNLIQPPLKPIGNQFQPIIHTFISSSSSLRLVVDATEAST